MQKERDGDVRIQEDDTVGFIEAIRGDVLTPKRPADWRNILKNRTSKRKLIAYLCESLGEVGFEHLEDNNVNQRLKSIVVEGACEGKRAKETTRGWSISGRMVKSELVDTYRNEHAEADTVIFLHAKYCGESNVLHTYHSIPMCYSSVWSPNWIVKPTWVPPASILIASCASCICSIKSREVAGTRRQNISNIQSSWKSCERISTCVVIATTGYEPWYHYSLSSRTITCLNLRSSDNRHTHPSSKTEHNRVRESASRRGHHRIFVRRMG